MKISLYVAFCVLIATGIACSSDRAETNHAVDTMTPAPAANSFAYDPFFLETTDTFSVTGPSNITRDVLQALDGTFWIASWEGLWMYRDSMYTNMTVKENLPPCRVYSLYQSRDGVLWFGTMGAGVIRYDGKDYSLLSVEDGLISNFVECISESPKGVMLFGTSGGLSIYNGKTFTNLGADQGIAGAVHAVAGDSTEKIWVGTDNGLFSRTGSNFTAVPKSVLHNDFFVNVRSLAFDRSGTLWVGGNDGLYKLLPYTYSGVPGDFTFVMRNFTSYIRDDREGYLLMSVGAGGTGNTGMMLLNMRGNKTDTLAIHADHNDDQIFGAYRGGTGKVYYGTMQGMRTN